MVPLRISHLIEVGQIVRIPYMTVFKISLKQSLATAATIENWNTNQGMNRV